MSDDGMYLISPWGEIKQESKRRIAVLKTEVCKCFAEMRFKHRKRRMGGKSVPSTE